MHLKHVVSATCRHRRAQEEGARCVEEGGAQPPACVKMPREGSEDRETAGVRNEAVSVGYVRESERSGWATKKGEACLWEHTGARGRRSAVSVEARPMAGIASRPFG